MGKYRKRFNEKARAGMLAKQAALKRARNKQFYRQDHDESDQEQGDVKDATQIFNNENSNSEILVPVTEEERQTRKRALEETLYTQNEKQEKLSKSKKKRLDKYIDHQLKRRKENFT